MSIRRESSAEAVALSAAARLEHLLARKPEAVLLLPAGSTPIPVYRQLRASGVDASRARIIQLDEIVGVGPDDPRSFNAFLREHWMGQFGTPNENALLLEGTADDPAAEIARHAERLAELGPPDMVLLGIGQNGHVAFNEPGTSAHATARVVDLAATTRKALASSFAPDAPPTTGITLGLAELASGAATLLIATGASKAPVLARLSSEAPSEELPASLLTHLPNFELIADAAALGDQPSETRP